MVMQNIVQPVSDESLRSDVKVRKWDCANAEPAGWLDSNGMKHANYGHAQPNSVCLRAMVDEFMEMEGNFRTSPSASVDWWHTHYTGFCNGACSARGFGSSLCCPCVSDSASISTAKEAVKELDSVLRAAEAGVDAKLAAMVARAVKEAEQLQNSGSAVCAAPARWLVWKYLKRAGYNAGICKSEGKPMKGASLDGHEYVDVIMEEASSDYMRLLVDVGFRCHFEIARASPAYEQLLRMLPENFIGSSMTLQRVVRVMCQAAKASMESQGMPVPPWRRLSFMHAKWYAPHSRISSLEEDSTVATTKLLPAPKHTSSSRKTIKVDLSNHSRVDPKAQLARSAPIPVEEPWQPPLVKLSSHRKVGCSSGALAIAIMEARMTQPMPKSLTPSTLPIPHSQKPSAIVTV